MSIYELITDDNGNVVKRTDETGQVWWIPTDPSNSDYQAYLEWLAEQKPSKKAPAQDDEANA